MKCVNYVKYFQSYVTLFDSMRLTFVMELTNTP
jgi:hypothetical protein